MKNKIKIIHIIPSLDLGGAERLLFDLVSRFDKDVFDIKVLCLKRGGHFSDMIERSGTKVIFRNRPSIPLFMDIVWLFSFFKKERPDIVHTHLFGADVYGRLAARLAGVPKVVSTEHNLNISENFLKRIMKRATSRLSDVVIAVSEAVSVYAQKKEGVAKSKVKIIHNGVAVDDFLYEKRDYDSQKYPVVGFVGRLTRQKGVDILLDALANTELPIKCKIAGDGEMRKELKNISSGKGLDERVQFLGGVNNVQDFLKAVDIFVLPSRWEGFGIALVEAGLSGLPVIVSRVDGIKEIISEGKDGLFFKAGDADELAGKLDDLSRDSKKRKTLGNNLQKKCLKYFSLKKMIKEYQAVYEQLVKDI